MNILGPKQENPLNETQLGIPYNTFSEAKVPLIFFFITIHFIIIQNYFCKK